MTKAAGTFCLTLPHTTPRRGHTHDDVRAPKNKKNSLDSSPWWICDSVDNFDSYMCTN